MAKKEMEKKTEELRKRISIGDFFINDILKSGKILYEKLGVKEGKRKYAYYQRVCFKEI